MLVLQQLVHAVQEGREQQLRELLSLVDERGRSAVTDDDIHSALCVAARENSDIACRILWERLSARGKKKRYFASRTATYWCPLHLALIYGHYAIARLLVQEFKFSHRNLNTPLCIVLGLELYTYTSRITEITDAERLEMVRFLLENGAKVNQGGKCSPLAKAVETNSDEVCRLLLVEYQANPNPARRSGQVTYAEAAISNGNPEILRMLLEHGALLMVRRRALRDATTLNKLFDDMRKSRETKREICRILVEHAKDHHATTIFMRVTVEVAMKRGRGCQLLLDSGICPRMSLYCAIRAKNRAQCRQLVHLYQVDPFLQKEDDETGVGDGAEHDPSSPFVTAARLKDTAIFEYFLGVWNHRFTSTGGKNSDGDYPLHVVCCDPHVSLPAIVALVNHQADALAAVDGEQGLYPFHFAAMWSASLDVIFYLLQHYPDALLSHRYSGISATSASAGCATSAAGGATDARDGVHYPSLNETPPNSANPATMATLAAKDIGPLKKKAKTHL
jgi:Ankyrin repeats (3 copies)